MEYTNPTLVHVGLFKSGSTSLQDNVFANHSGAVNVWKPTYENILRRMIQTDQIDLEGEKESIVKFLDAAQEKATKENKTLVLSNEQIAGLPLLWPSAHRIKQFLPNSKIFLCVREQRALIESFYVAFWRNLGGLFGTPERYSDLPIYFDEFFAFHFPDADEAGVKTQNFLQLCWRLKYMKTANLYREMFGDKNVLVLPIEMSSNDPDEFAARLEEFAGLDAEETVKLLGLKQKNVGLEKRMHGQQASDAKSHVVYERWRRRLPAGIAFSKLVPFGSQIRDIVKRAASRRRDQLIDWDERKISKITDLYSKQNQDINEIYKLNLERYGYII